jgi:simple sugar transport system ATP-binding protein
VFITHNVHRAWLIGDSFEILKRGRASQAFEKAEISKDRLLIEMAGGEDLNQLEAALSAN